MFKAVVNVTLRKSILDPRGKASEHALHSLGFNEISAVRIGKVIHLDIDAASVEEARSRVGEACEQLLANPVMEDYSVSIQEVVEA